MLYVEMLKNPSKKFLDLLWPNFVINYKHCSLHYYRCGTWRQGDAVGAVVNNAAELFYCSFYAFRIFMIQTQWELLCPNIKF